jgi:hypothetical protein
LFSEPITASCSRASEQRFERPSHDTHPYRKP